MARILLADDDAEQIAVQRKLLEALGYEVSAALSPSETLCELERRRPDLIVVDLSFPSPAEGLKLIRGIRQTGYAEPVIVLSGWPEALYSAPEEQMVSKVLVKGGIRELLSSIAELVGGYS
jgi:CheY-like chemotaxis protein